MSLIRAQNRVAIKERMIGKIIDGGVSIARSSAWFRDRAFQYLANSMECSYSEMHCDEAQLQLFRWFGRSLKPFFDRLVQERPRAASAIVRFAHTWACDVRRRNPSGKLRDVTPATVVIEPTDRCNLNCPGCYAHSTKEGSDLSYETIKYIIKECRAMGTSLVTLSGGEPFLREKEDRVITRLAAEFPNLGFLVYTNGVLIDEEIAQGLARVGNVFPAISVEGFEQETDHRRGKGVFRRTNVARRLLAENDVMFGFSATATSENCDLLATDAFIDSRIAAGDLFGWFFIFQPIGRNPRPDLMVTAEQRMKLREMVYRTRDLGKPIFIGDFWNDGPLSSGCIAAGTGYFHVYANGDISPCVFSPISAGNVHDIIDGKGPYASVKDLLETHPLFVNYRQEQKKICDYRSPCVLIDHPEMIREICKKSPWVKAKNMPSTYLEGDIAAIIDERAQEWKHATRSSTPLDIEIGPALEVASRRQTDEAAT